ncbi:MAG: acyl-CoA dehydrogenase family protein [Myxococcota bacterium]
MTTSLSEPERTVRDAAASIASSVLRHQASVFEGRGEIDPDVFRHLGERGLMAVNVPRDCGGSEMGVRAYCRAMIEIGAACAATAVSMAVTNMVGEVIARFGSSDQRARYCPRLAAGALGAFALSEVSAGSDPSAMQTRADRVAHGWMLQGTKHWITHGDTAEVLVVWARTGASGTKGLSCFLVERGAPGLSVQKNEQKMGLRASHTVSLAFDEVHVPDEALLGGLGSGFSVAMMALDGGRIGIASQAIGIARGAQALIKTMLRQQDVPQGVACRIADNECSLEAATLLALRAAALKEEGAPHTKEASMAKLYASESAFLVCNRCLEIASLMNLDSEDFARRVRDVRVTRIYEGTSEIQRLVLGRAVISEV